MEEKQEATPKTKIALCVPTYNNVSAHWLIQFIKFITTNFSKYDMMIYVTEGQPASRVREDLIKNALTDNPDYIFFMDSDNLIPERAIDRLLAAMKETGADLMSGLYFTKDAPHYAVLREYRSDGFWIVDNVPMNQRIQIAGCGLGICLIKADIFKQIERPWFMFSHEKWGQKNIMLSEDLYFCRKVMRKGFKMYADTGCISDHIGGIVGAMEYMTFSPIREQTKLEREELFKDMEEYTGRTQKDVDMDIMVGPELMRDEWNKKNPKTKEEILKFYKETKNYLYDLACWHAAARRQFDVEVQTAVTATWGRQKETVFKDRAPKVLDFGTGIGQNALMLARIGCEVTLADVDGYTLDFAKYRFDKHNVPYKVWKTDLEDMPPEEKYDIILAFDVFEHLHQDDLMNFIRKLNKLKEPHTEVMSTTSFGKSSGHPMHMDGTDEAMAEIVKLLKDKPSI